MPPVPGPRARRFLLFECVVLLEYFAAPPLLGLTNYAGTWSEIGSALFVVLLASLVVGVLLPLRWHLRAALRSRAAWAGFLGLAIGSFLVGLFVTNTLQFTAGPTGGPVLLGSSTVYTPLGAWPSLTVFFPALQLFATLNVATPALLGLLSVLSAGAFVLPARPALACLRRPTRPATWGARAASSAVLAPLGFLTGCPSCLPAYFSLFGLLAPEAAARTYDSLPLVPWLGFAGLAYLGGLGLAIGIISRRTRGARTDRGPGP